MIKLHLKDGNVIESESKDARMIECTCRNVWCNHCPFGMHCVVDFCDMTFGEAMKEREDRVNSLVDYIEETYNVVKPTKQEESTKKYTFEFTDEQAMYLHAFMNVFEHDAIERTLNTLEFFDHDNAPFVYKDVDKLPIAWECDDVPYVVNLIHAISQEIYNKLNMQREFDE